MRGIWIWSIAAGLFAGLISGAPWYIYLIGYLFVSGLARLLARRVWQASLLVMFTVTFTGSLLLLMLTYFYRSLFEVALPFGISFSEIILPSIMLNLLLSIPVHALVNDLAKRAFPEESIGMKNRYNFLLIHDWRNAAIYAIMAGVAMIFISRLFNLQILNGQTYLAQAETNHTQTISVPAPRGIIYDRNSVLLARNTASYNIVITPASLPDDDGDIQRIYRELSVLTGVPVNHGTVEDAKLLQVCTPGPGITQLVDLGISNAPYDPVYIQCNVDEKIAMAVREHGMDWPGVSMEIEPVRDYPTGSLTANVVGFLGPIPAVAGTGISCPGLFAQPGQGWICRCGIFNE